MPQRAAWFLPQGYGGGGKIPAQGGATPHSAICLILLWLSFVNRPRPCRTGEKEGDESDPPPKSGGGHVTLDSWRLWHASIRPHAGRSRPYLSLREGSEKTPRSGVDQAENGPMELREWSLF